MKCGNLTKKQFRRLGRSNTNTYYCPSCIKESIPFSSVSNAEIDNQTSTNTHINITPVEISSTECSLCTECNTDCSTCINCKDINRICDFCLSCHYYDSSQSSNVQ